jgi:ADA HAT complex component 1
MADLASADAEGEAEAEESDLDSAFPRQSLETLTAPLRGVGPATASLILSVATEAAPFYSDDVFLWLCLGVFPSSAAAAAAAAAEDGGEKKGGVSKRIRPNGELNVKYNIQEYRELWEAVQRLRARLAAQSSDAVSCADVEKVAFVLRHYNVSVYSVEDNNPASAQEVEETKRKSDQDVQAGEERSSKRRR